MKKMSSKLGALVKKLGLTSLKARIATKLGPIAKKLSLGIMIALEAKAEKLGLTKINWKLLGKHVVKYALIPIVVAVLLFTRGKDAYKTVKTVFREQPVYVGVSVPSATKKTSPEQTTTGGTAEAFAKLETERAQAKAEAEEANQKLAANNLEVAQIKEQLKAAEEAKKELGEVAEAEKAKVASLTDELSQAKRETEEAKADSEKTKEELAVTQKELEAAKLAANRSGEEKAASVGAEVSPPDSSESFLALQLELQSLETRFLTHRATRLAQAKNRR